MSAVKGACPLSGAMAIGDEFTKALQPARVCLCGLSCSGWHMRPPGLDLPLQLSLPTGPWMQARCPWASSIG